MGMGKKYRDKLQHHWSQVSAQAPHPCKVHAFDNVGLPSASNLHRKHSRTSKRSRVSGQGVIDSI